jgi:hypothetical protein
MTVEISHFEPAPRLHMIALSTAELAAVIAYHARYVTAVERALPDLAPTVPAKQRDEVLELAAAQLSAHSQRRAELEDWLATGLADIDAITATPAPASSL